MSVDSVAVFVLCVFVVVRVLEVERDAIFWELLEDFRDGWRVREIATLSLDCGAVWEDVDDLVEVLDAEECHEVGAFLLDGLAVRGRIADVALELLCA